MAPPGYPKILFTFWSFIGIFLGIWGPDLPFNFGFGSPIADFGFSVADLSVVLMGWTYIVTDFDGIWGNNGEVGRSPGGGSGLTYDEGKSKGVGHGSNIHCLRGGGQYESLSAFEGYGYGGLSH